MSDTLGLDAASLRELLPELEAIARRAGEAILEIYGTDFAVERKDDASPLTAADLASHRLIVDGLAALTPATPRLSEESADLSWERRRDWRSFWLIDPLDGTKEFVNRNGEFTVNIALINDHRPILGVIFAPVPDLLYAGAAGVGSQRRRRGGEHERIAARRPPARPPVVAGSRSHGQEGLARFLERLGPHELRTVGSSLKFCLVAEGSADIYPRFGPTSEWDTAAGQAVVEAAGGAVLDTAGAPLRYNRTESILNPDFLVLADPSARWLREIAAGAEPSA